MQTHNTQTSRPTTRFATISHFVPFDAPGYRMAKALCGVFVDRRREHATEPTCPDCRQALQTLDAMEF